MGFWGKTAKITAIAGMAVGGALTITGATLLGVGCNATISSTGGEKTGIGATNFGKIWDANGNVIQGASEISNNINYWDFVDLARKAKNNNIIWKNLSQEIKNQINTVISAADETISGAVLFSIFVLVLGASIAIFFINRKRA